MVHADNEELVMVVPVGVYDSVFLQRDCSFGELPDYLAWDRLYNVSYDLHTAIVKLYFLDATKSFLYKVSHQGITRQYSAEVGKVDPRQLSAFLGKAFNYNQILIDTVEDDVFYVYLLEAPLVERGNFLQAVCTRYGISKEQLIAATNRINARQMGNFYDCLRYHGIAGIKIPLTGDACKIYARPFEAGNDYLLDPRAEHFLTRLYHCEPGELRDRLRYMWVSTEILSGRMVLTTQYHELVHDD